MKPKENLHCDCAVCGHQWTRRKGEPEPERCPDPKCRSLRWKTGVDRRFKKSNIGVERAA